MDKNSIGATESKELLEACYPDWAEHIRQGDFVIRITEKGKEATWTNTEIFCPTAADLEMVLAKEFGDFEKSDIRIKAGIVSLSVIAEN